MTSPANEIAIWLEAEGLGTISAASGWAISTAISPETPDDVITVYDTGGTAPDNDTQDVFNPTIQVRTRSTSYPEGFAKQEAIKAALLARGVEGTINAVWMESEPQAIGADDNARFLITSNYKLLKSA